MPYDYLNYCRRQYDLPQPAPPFQQRRATCWDPPRSRDPPAVPPYDQLPPRYRREPYGSPQPHRMGSVQTRRPTCWDPPRHRTDNCYPPPYRDPDMVPDSYVEPRNSYARYRPWQPQYHPRPATKAEAPINAKLDRILEAFDRIETWVGATNRRLSKLRSSPHPEPDLDQPKVSAPLRKMAYPPSRSNEASLGPSGLFPNDSSAPSGHLCSAAPPPAAAAPPPSLRSDLPLKQTRTTSTIELPPDALPRPCQPLLPLAVKAPLSASTRQMQADVSSSRKTELETDMHESAEKMEEKLIVLNNVWNQKEIEKWDDFTAKREEEVNNTFLKTEKELQAEALGASLETKERDLSMLPEKQSRIEKMEIQSLVDEHTDGFEMKKHDNRLEMEEKPRLFENELKWKTEELGKIGDGSSTCLPVIVCVYVDLNFTYVTSMMNPKLLSLDADARLIPPRNNKPCLSIQGCVTKLFVLTLICHDNNVAGVSAISYIQQGFLLAILGGNDDRRCSTLRCVFDPGGDASPKLLLSTLVVASWFPP